MVYKPTNISGGPHLVMASVFFCCPDDLMVPSFDLRQIQGLAAVGDLPLISQGTQDLVTRQQRKVQLPADTTTEI